MEALVVFLELAMKAARAHMQARTLVAQLTAVGRASPFLGIKERAFLPIASALFVIRQTRGEIRVGDGLVQSVL